MKYLIGVFILLNLLLKAEISSAQNSLVPTDLVPAGVVDPQKQNQQQNNYAPPPEQPIFQDNTGGNLQLSPPVINSDGTVQPPGPPPKSAKKEELKELEKKLNSRIKDPFMLPSNIFIKIKRENGDLQEGFIDDTIEAKIRWPLKYYTLVAVIWNVKKPKVMVADRKGDLHMFYVGDAIGSGAGIITSIRNAEVIVSEKTNETVMKLNGAK